MKNIITIVISLLMFSSLFAATYSESFEVTNNYSYNTTNITVSGGLAQLKTPTYSIDADTNVLYHLDEPSGVINDESANNYDSTVVGGALYAQDGKIGTSIYFDGVDDYLNGVDVSGVAVSEWTMEAWIKLASTANNQCIITVGGSTYGFKLFARDNHGNIKFLSTYNTLDLYEAVTANGSLLTVGTWHHVAGVYDGSNYLKLFVDGIEAATATSTIASIGDWGGVMSVGQDEGFNAVNESPFHGYIDEVRVSDVKRESFNLYVSSNPVITPVSSFSTTTLAQWSSFTETLGNNSTGTINYQISVDNGTTWNFNDSSISNKWTIYSAPTYGSISESSGSINITTTSLAQTGTPGGDMGIAPHVVQSLPATQDWTIETYSPSRNFNANYHFGGFLIKDNDDNYMWLGVYYSSGNLYCSFRVWNNGTQSVSGAGSPQVSTDENTPVWFRITKTGNIYHGWYSLNGSNWIDMQTISKTMSSTQAGFYLSNWIGNTAIGSIAFDYFKVTTSENMTNIASELTNEAMNALSIHNKQITFRSFLESDGLKSVKLDSIVIGYKTKYIPKMSTNKVNIINFPNPCSGEKTTFRYQLNEESSAVIKVYTKVGKLIKTIKIDQGQDGGKAGLNEVEWDLSNDYGEDLANDVYLYFIHIKSANGKNLIGKNRLVYIKR